MAILKDQPTPSSSSSSSTSKPKLSKTSQKALSKSRQALSESSGLLSTKDLPEGLRAGGDDGGEDEDMPVDEDFGKERKGLIDVLREDVDDDDDDREDQTEEQDDAIMIDPSSLPTINPPTSTTTTTTSASTNNPLSFPPISSQHQQVPTQTRVVAIPPHRMTPLKRDWVKLYAPLVEECGLLVRMNVNRRRVEIKTSKHTSASPLATTSSSTSSALSGPGNVIQRAQDFVGAYALGFGAEDALALLRMEDVFIESFEIKDVKTLHGDHLSRAIGRIAGKDGKTRYTIENASRTRIVLAETKIHILGTFQSIKIARDAVCALILGSPPGKVYNGLRQVAARRKSRF